MTRQMDEKASATKSSAPRRVKVRIPGSTSNLGPGFDTLGLALTIYNTFTVEPVEERKDKTPQIILTGENAAELPTDQSNLVYGLLNEKLKDHPEILPQLKITIDSNIPLAGGLGSSGTATIAACWIAQVLKNGQAHKEQVLLEATQIEGHPDNVSPSLLGGFIVCGASPNKRQVFTQQLRWPDNWQTIFVLPQYGLTTKHARSVLPKRIAHADAVHNVQRVSLLLGAIINEDEKVFRQAMHDKLHEPYREQLVPEIVALRKAIAGWPVIGCCLSGAGPSIMLVTPRRHHKEVMSELKKWTSGFSKPSRILDLKVDKEGLKQLND